MTDQTRLADIFKALHAPGRTFVIPNPWDRGSARLLQGLGFEALATTSSGFAFSIARLDGQVTPDEKLEHCRELASVVDIPINADLENGFADDPAEAAANIARMAASGIVGGSIEDWSGERIYDFDHAVERVQATVEAVRKLDFHFMLTARAEGLLRGHADLDDALKRLQAFEAVGADVLYAPSLKTLEDVKLVTGEVGLPVNVLAPTMSGPVTVSELADAGATRISIGGALARAAIGTTLSAGREMLDGGFVWLDGMAAGGEIAKLLGGGRPG